jgi:CheY-like chemotaxis protein
MNFLVVEDEIILGLNLKDSIEEMGHEVVHLALSGEEAIEATLHQKVDFAFIDYTLSGNLNGIETANILRTHLPELMIVFLTGRSNLDSELPKLTNKMNCQFLTKPVSDQKIKDIISEFCA